MKRILTFMLAFVMIAALSVSAFAVDNIPEYSGNWEEDVQTNAGEINATKHTLINAGNAGIIGTDDNMFNVPGVQGDAVPTIDGECTDDEGYEDMAGFEDYLYIGANAGTYTAEEFSAWYEEVQEMDLTMKYCWDGNDIYFYIEYTVDSYLCSANTAADLWKHNCIQLGIASSDALVLADMSETIFGVNAFTEMPMSGTTGGGGSYVPVVGSDYMGSFAVDDETGKYIVKHEIKANICEALSTEEVMNAGDLVKVCIVIQCSTKPGNSAAQRFLSFGHGITGQESSKMPKHFINFMLGTGFDPNVQEGYEAYYTPTEDEMDCDYRETVSFFFHQIKDTDDFAAANGTHTVATDDDKYGIFTTEDAMARFTSAKYPSGLWAGGDLGATHAVVRYRTTDEMTLGINMINNGMNPLEGSSTVEFIPEATAYPMTETPIIADGEWHDAIIKLSDCTAFVGQIVSTGIEISAGTIEIESIKFFGWDPSEIYGIGYVDEGCACDDCEDGYCPCEGECDEDLCDCSCDFDAEPGTDEPGTDEPGTDEPGTDEPGTDAPGTDDPSTDAPSTDAPSTDAPSTDAPSTDAPSTDAPSTDAPSTDAPSTDAPSTDAPSTDNKTEDKTEDKTDDAAKKDGCKSSIAAGAALVVVASIASGAVLLKKKED